MQWSCFSGCSLTLPPSFLGLSPHLHQRPYRVLSPPHTCYILHSNQVSLSFHLHCFLSKADKKELRCCFLETSGASKTSNWRITVTSGRIWLKLGQQVSVHTVDNMMWLLESILMSMRCFFAMLCPMWGGLTCNQLQRTATCLILHGSQKNLVQYDGVSLGFCLHYFSSASDHLLRKRTLCCFAQTPAVEIGTREELFLPRTQATKSRFMTARLSATRHPA